MNRKLLPAYQVYLIIEFTGRFGFTTFATLSALYRIETVGLNPFELVLVGTCLELAAFLGETPTGIVADVYSRRLSVIIGTLLVGLGFIVEGLFPLLATVLIAQVIWGIGSTFMSGALEAWIADERGDSGIGRIYLRGSQVGQFGSILGIPVAVLLASFGFGAPLVAGGVITLLLGVFLIFVMPESNFSGGREAGSSAWNAMSETFSLGLRTIRGRPLLITITLIAILYGAASEGYDRLADKHLLDSFTFPVLPAGPLDSLAIWFGLISAAGMLINIGVSEVIRRRIDTDSHDATAKTLLATNFLIVGAIIGFALAGQFTVAIGFMLSVNIFRRLYTPLTTTWLNQNLSSRVRATVISMSNQGDALGQIIGGPILGVIATLISLQVSFLVTATILSPAIYLYVRSLRMESGVADETSSRCGDSR